MLPTMGSLFPSGIAKRYARQPAGKARMLTCRDQYRADRPPALLSRGGQRKAAATTASATSD